MKVDTTRLEPLASTPTADAVAKTSSSGKGSGVSDVQDSVGLSSIGMLAAKIDNISEERIQELRRQVANGSYHVDAQKISQKLVDSILEK